MKRRLLNLLTGLALLLCVASTALSVRSHFQNDWFAYHDVRAGAEPREIRSTIWTLWTGNGKGCAGRSRSVFDDSERSLLHPSGWIWEDGSPWNKLELPAGRWAGFDFTVRRSADPNARQSEEVRFPLWALPPAFALLPAARLYRRVRSKYAPGHCPRCGYDLRATPDRCPECGRAAGGGVG
jgi:hypothetical protein